jgi:predicted cupin superfamily sugar epimerase
VSTISASNGWCCTSIGAQQEREQGDSGDGEEIMTAEEVAALLGLEPHPTEGGFFRETYRSEGDFQPGGLYQGLRAHGTAIYYLLTSDSYSAMHRLPGDEIFHFYLGDPVEMIVLRPDGRGEVVLLGPDLEAMTVQHVVRGGMWQGSRLVDGGSWALMGTTMAPGFDFADYVTGTDDLLDLYPEYREAIEARLP